MGALAIAGLIASVLPYVGTIVQDVEGLFGAGNGQQKLSLAVSTLSTAIQGSLVGAQAAGATNVTQTIQSVVPVLTNAVNATVAAMNASGALPKATTTSNTSDETASTTAATPAPTAVPPAIGAGV